MIYVITVKKYKSDVIRKEFIQDYCYTDFNLLKKGLKKQGYKKINNEKYIKLSSTDPSSYIIKTIGVINTYNDGERLKPIQFS